jgi:integrase
MPSYRKKPLAQFEHGTRIYAPSSGESRYRVVTTDNQSDRRVVSKCRTEELARAKAHEFEQFLALATPIHSRRNDGPRTVESLAATYVADHLTHLSLRYREKHEYLLRRWILPGIGTRAVTAWSSADSASIISAARLAGASDALVQDIGGAMRALVTHARRLRWLTAQSEDPMWMVHYAKKATLQGAPAVYVARSALPTDDQCQSLFDALEELGHHRWAVAMKLKHRSGLRWGELTALQASDVEFEPARVVHVRRAVEQGASGPATLKTPKNGKVRTSIFPKSIADEIRSLVDEVGATGGPQALIFPAARGGIMRRSSFQQIWARAADAAGWPMTTPLRRSAGYGEKNKGWRWTGAARWSPHDLRHVAACWMLFDVGLDPAIVADKLGHADPAFTIKRYIGVRGDADATATRLTEEW